MTLVGKKYFYLVFIFALICMCSGCKTSGVIEMNKETPKSLVRAEIKAEGQTMILMTPLDISLEKLKSEPVDSSITYIDKHETLKKNNNKVSCNITHEVFKKEAMKESVVTEDELLRLAVEDFLENVKNYNLIKKYEIKTNEKTTINNLTARKVQIDYTIKDGDLTTKVIYVMKDNHVWIVCYDIMANDTNTKKAAEESFASIKIM